MINVDFCNNFSCLIDCMKEGVAYSACFLISLVIGMYA